VLGRHFGGFLVQAALRWLFGLELGLFGVCVKIRRKSSQNSNKSQRKSKKVKQCFVVRKFYGHHGLFEYLLVKMA
jgi:hypothetical protein